MTGIRLDLLDYPGSNDDERLDALLLDVFNRPDYDGGMISIGIPDKVCFQDPHVAGILASGTSIMFTGLGMMMNMTPGPGHENVSRGPSALSHFVFAIAVTLWTTLLIGGVVYLVHRTWPSGVIVALVVVLTVLICIFAAVTFRVVYRHDL